MTPQLGVNEVPSVFMHMAGTEGNTQTVELSAWAYVVETTQETYRTVSAKLFGPESIATVADPGVAKKICTASFGPQEYDTTSNGKVWIMGAPLFYATNVAYDLKGANGKPQMSFMEGPCTPCSEETASLLSEDQRTVKTSPSRIERLTPSRKGPTLRRLTGTIREPGVDVTQPL